MEFLRLTIGVLQGIRDADIKEVVIWLAGYKLKTVHRYYYVGMSCTESITLVPNYNNAPNNFLQKLRYMETCRQLQLEINACIMGNIKKYIQE